MIGPVLSTASTFTTPALIAKHGFEVILRILNNPQKYIGVILAVSVIVIVLPLTGLCYAVKKIYERCFPETD